MLAGASTDASCAEAGRGAEENKTVARNSDNTIRVVIFDLDGLNDETLFRINESRIKNHE